MQTFATIVPRITAREHEVLGLLASGRKNSEIATALGITRGTVDQHVHSILVKLGAATRHDAAARYAQGGVRPTPSS